MNRDSCRGRGGPCEICSLWTNAMISRYYSKVKVTRIRTQNENILNNRGLFPQRKRFTRRQKKKKK